MQNKPEIMAEKPEKQGFSLNKMIGDDRTKKYGRFVLAALGSIHWVGGVLAAISTLSGETDQEKTDALQRAWLEEHSAKIDKLVVTLEEIFSRLDDFGDAIKERIESPEYLALVRKSFKSWDNADTEEKRQMLKKLITNAGAKSLCPDDLIRLFIDWIDKYHEAHFAVIREIYKNPGVTRAAIWEEIYEGDPPREDSSEADLYKYLIRELNLGQVIRQARDTDMQGRFLKKSTRGRNKMPQSNIMESAFEDTKPYVLTELGSQFVHYVMEDLAPQITE